MHTSFIPFSTEIFINIILGICFGIIINKSVNHLIIYQHISLSTQIVIQILLNIILLFIIKKYKLLNTLTSWKDDNSYGIVFISLLFLSQNNIRRYMDDLYHPMI